MSPNTTADASHSSIPASTSAPSAPPPPPRFRLQIFQRHMSSLYAHRKRTWTQADGSLRSSIKDADICELGWLHLAAVWNPAAALQFHDLAHIIEHVRMLHTPPSPLPSAVSSVPSEEDPRWRRDPLSYLRAVQFTLPRMLTGVFLNWQRRLSRQGGVDQSDGTDVRAYALCIEALDDALSSLYRMSVVETWELLKEECFAPLAAEDAVVVIADPFVGLAAVDHIFNEFTRIVWEMKEFLDSVRGGPETEQAPV